MSRELTWRQEQTIKATQVSQLEEELAKAREENAALLARAKELDDAEISRKKAEAKAQQLEERMDEIIAEKDEFIERPRNIVRILGTLSRELALSGTTGTGHGPAGGSGTSGRCGCRFRSADE